MHRRAFFRSSATTVAAAAAVSLPRSDVRATDTQPATATARPSGTPAILLSYTADDHRRRLSNVGICNRKIRQCLRRHLITDYLAGQCVYNMGEYPSRTPWEPGEYDEQELDRLKEHGIQLIHVMDEWNDRYGLFGGNKLTAVNPEGFRRFVAMVHGAA